MSDSDEGVLCQENPRKVLEILQQNGFNLQNESTENEKTIWVVVKNEETDATNNEETEDNTHGDEQATDEQEE